MAINTDTSPVANWERSTLEKLLFSSLVEQRRRRRWGIFFKSLFFIYLFLILVLVWPTDTLPTPSREKLHTALVDVTGTISATGDTKADDVITALQDAFKDKNTKGIILRINSPGGSPVQAADIYNELHYLRNKHKNIKVYAVCADLCTSAAYYIASGADAIYANQSSLVGSIGVLLDGFGFVDTMQKLGVQRRLLISGAHKGFLDPFSPLKPDEQQFAQGLIDNVHQQFIHDVQQGRGNRLKDNPELFSGLVWTGSQALPLGLIDGFGDMHSVAREIIKTDNIVDYTVQPNYLEKFANKIGANFSKEIVGHALAGKIGLEE